MRRLGRLLVWLSLCLSLRMGVAVVPPAGAHEPIPPEAGKSVSLHFWARGDLITAERWNAMADRARCPAAKGLPQENVVRLSWLLAQCLAQQHGHYEEAGFFGLAAEGGIR